MEGPSTVNVEAIGALFRAALRKRKNSVEKLQRIERDFAGRAGMLAIFAARASKTPQPARGELGRICGAIAVYIGPKRCRYSLELMNAFTISDLM